PPSDLPLLVDRIPSGPWKRMWCELDPQPLEGLGQLVGVLESLRVGRPRARDPDLRVIARADDDGFVAEVDVLTQVGRQQDPALFVEIDLRRPGEDQALEAPRIRIGDGQCRDLRGEAVPSIGRVDGQAGIEPAGHDGARAQLGAELRRDGDPSLVVHRVPVLAGEHPWGLLGALAWSAGSGGSHPGSAIPHFPPLWTTSVHRRARIMARQCGNAGAIWSEASVGVWARRKAGT